MIYENSTRLFPDTCQYKGVLGYADLSSGDLTTITNVDFEVENALKGTKCYVALTAELQANESGILVVEVDDKDTGNTLGNSAVRAKDLQGAKEVRVPFFADRGNKTFVLKVTSTIVKGGLFATLKYEVG